MKGISPNLLGKVMGRCDIYRLDTPGKMKAHAGLAPGQRKKKGEVVDFDQELKSAFWIISRQLKMVKGKYYEYYISQKERLLNREVSSGKSVVPATSLPRDRRGEKQVTEHLISRKMLDNLALRKMTALFAVHLWAAWREAEGLPTREPYPVEYLGHNEVIGPWDMVDRKAKKGDR